MNRRTDRRTDREGDSYIPPPSKLCLRGYKLNVGVMELRAEGQVDRQTDNPIHYYHQYYTSKIYKAHIKHKGFS